MIDSHHGWNTNAKIVIIGFLLSLLCTCGAYFVVVEHLFRPWIFLGIVAGLGMLQTLLQLIFFFHLGQESKPRWNLAMFLFMILVVFLIIGGSLWIMYQLNYNMMLT